MCLERIVSGFLQGIDCVLFYWYLLLFFSIGTYFFTYEVKNAKCKGKGG